MPQRMYPSSSLFPVSSVSDSARQPGVRGAHSAGNGERAAAGRCLLCHVPCSPRSLGVTASECPWRCSSVCCPHWCSAPAVRVFLTGVARTGCSVVQVAVRDKMSGSVAIWNTTKPETRATVAFQLLHSGSSCIAVSCHCIEARRFLAKLAKRGQPFFRHLFSLSVVSLSSAIHIAACGFLFCSVCFFNFHIVDL